MSTLQLEPTPATRSSEPLGVVTGLCRRLAEAGVAYCHWKSNEHLGPAALGETDLDVLVDRESSGDLARVLAETGFKRMVAVPARSYVGVEDYLALDQTTGRLVHLHLHYRLILGEKFLKGYRVPWEARLLAGRRLDPETGVYVCAPELELVVLLVRAALKLRRRETLRPGIPGPLDADFHREFRWLAGRVDAGSLETQATELLGATASASIMAMLRTTPDRRAIARFRRDIAPLTDAWRTYPPVEATLRRWHREVKARSAKLWSRLSGNRPIIRLTNPRGGLIIAFLGADGSGKSTVTGAIEAWLSWRVEVVRLYLGFGDGPVSPIRRPLNALKSLYARRRARVSTPIESREARPGPEVTPRASLAAIPKILWRILWSWSVVREKQSRLARARQGRNAGLVVICDRYPQAQIMGLGDGPLMAHWERHPWAWVRRAARWELEAYRKMESVAPDLVIKLHVSPEVSAARKQDVSFDSLVRRVDVVKRVRFSDETRIAHVNADEPIDQVLLAVKRAAWGAL